MSLLYDEVYPYIERLNNIETENDVIVCPSNIYLEAFVNNSDFPVAAQNFHSAVDASHTGEISTDQLKSLGIEYSLVGHYERVAEFKENPSIVNEKLIAALDANIFPIVCLGENMDEDYRDVLPKLLDSYLKDIQNIQCITFAYEPIYAIDTGALPKREKIEEVIKFVKKYLEDKFGQKARILYGGSVDSSNIEEIIGIENLDGVLIGKISSDIKEVEKIISRI